MGTGIAGFLTKSPQASGLRLPYVAALLVIVLGFFWFELYGAAIGRFEGEITRFETRQIEAHPGVEQEEEGAKLSPDEAAAKAWERIKFFHGHGYQMVLASFVFLLLIVNSPMRERTKQILVYVALIAMVLYNVGWGLAGWLVPYLGAEGAKRLGEYGFFIPFGLTIIAVTGFIAFVYARELVRPPHAPGG